MSKKNMVLELYSGCYDVDCDIFSPAAFGGTINENTIPRLKCKVVAGAANNQLQKILMQNLLQKRDIYFMPGLYCQLWGRDNGHCRDFWFNI